MTAWNVSPCPKTSVQRHRSSHIGTEGYCVIRSRYIILMVPLLFIGALMAPQWSQWRTGRPTASPMALAPVGPGVVQPGRIWIDTDAACGATGRTDPDDCFAIAWLLAQGVDITGVSTSFGNAPGHGVADRLAALLAQLDHEGLSPPPMFVGYSAPAADGVPSPPGIAALQSSLEDGPLTILALGPLTNVAAALNNRRLAAKRHAHRLRDGASARSPIPPDRR